MNNKIELIKEVKHFAYLSTSIYISCAQRMQVSSKILFYRIYNELRIAPNCPHQGISPGSMIRF